MADTTVGLHLEACVFSVPEEDALVTALCQGADDAYEILLQRYQQPVYNLVYRLMNDPSDASDIVQEVFLKVFKNIGNFRGNSSLKKIFTDAGAKFDGKSGAPYFEIDGAKTKNLTVTLDHFIERRVDNPARAVDALNVRPTISFENSATLEAIRRDNFLKGWKSPIDP